VTQIVEFMALFTEFRRSSWDKWRGILARLTSDVREFFCIVGRGAGKSRIVALLACAFASRDYTRVSGENIYIGIFAPDKKQAGVTFTHAHGSQRVAFYACDSYHRRGASVCTNRLEVPMKQTDAVVLGDIARQVLSADIIEEMVARAVAAAQQTNPEQRLAEVSKELRSVETQIHRFVEAVGRGVDVPELVAALKKAQTRRAELTRTIAALERQREQLNDSGLRDDIESRVNAWRKLMQRHVPQARQILRKMKVGIQFELVEQHGQPGYRFRGTASISGLLAGLPLLVTSPSGFEPEFWP
jgi:hypothetical protein